MKRIVIIHSDNIFSIPPVYSALLVLNDLGYEVSLITKGINEFWENELNSRGIKYRVITTAISNNRYLNKIYERLKYKKLVKQNLLELGEFDYYWLEGKKTFDYLGKSFFQNKKFIIHVLELYEKLPFFRKKLSWFFNNSEVAFVPELIRANLFRMWFNLAKLPVILPNCPYKNFEIDSSKSNIKENFPELYNLIEQNKKIILYQGGIGKERDITNIIKYIDTLDEEFVFVIIGPPSGVKECLNLSKRVHYLGLLPAPLHLVVTSQAFIGILGYKGILMNNLFCAPNKIYEYSKFGIPMIGNDIPGLYFPLKLYNAGVTCDTNSMQSIELAFNEIFKNYITFSNGAIELYNASENVEIVKKALLDLNS